MKERLTSLKNAFKDAITPDYSEKYRSQSFGGINTKTANLVARHAITTGAFASAVTTTVLWTKNIQKWKNKEELPNSYESLTQTQKTAYDKTKYDSFGGDHHQEYYNFFADMPNGRYGELYSKISAAHSGDVDDSQKMLDYLISEVSKGGKTKLGTSIKATIENTQTDILTNKVSNFNDFNELFKPGSDYYIGAGQNGVVTAENYNQSFLAYYTSKAPLTEKPAVNIKDGTDKTKIDFQKNADGIKPGATTDEKKTLQDEVTRIHNENCPYINSYLTSSSYKETGNLEKLDKDPTKIDYDIWYAGTPRPAIGESVAYVPKDEQKKALLHEISRVHNKAHPENPIYFNKEDVPINGIVPQMQQKFYTGLNAKFDVSTTMLDAMGKAGFTSLLVFQWLFFVLAAISSGHAQMNMNKNSKSTTPSIGPGAAEEGGSSDAGQDSYTSEIDNIEVPDPVDTDLVAKQQAILDLYKEISEAKIELLERFIKSNENRKFDNDEYVIDNDEYVIDDDELERAKHYISKERERIRKADISSIDCEINHPVPVNETEDNQYPEEEILNLFSNFTLTGEQETEKENTLKAILEANKINLTLAIVKQELENKKVQQTIKDSTFPPQEFDNIAQPFKDYKQSANSPSPKPIQATNLLGKLRELSPSTQAT